MADGQVAQRAFVLKIYDISEREILIVSRALSGYSQWCNDRAAECAEKTSRAPTGAVKQAFDEADAAMALRKQLWEPMTVPAAIAALREPADAMDGQGWFRTSKDRLSIDGIFTREQLHAILTLMSTDQKYDSLEAPFT